MPFGSPIIPACYSCRQRAECGNWTTGFRGFCIFVLRFEAVLLVAVFLCVAKVMVLPQGAVQSVNSVNMVDSSVTRVERMAGYADLLTAFHESNGVEDLF